jgi:hypothetical protein
MQFRKKPVVIEAVKFVNDAFSEIDGDHPAWYTEARLLAPEKTGAISYSRLKGSSYGILIIQTLEGAMRAVPGDWIIRGVKGEIYAIKDEIMHMTYDPVQD